ncbi:MAG TPA: hypothetical protein ENN19_08250 [Chloroflexi bacterium]|nr:hypothetical protein [Chloroflexota bacterium]
MLSDMDGSETFSSVQAELQACFRRLGYRFRAWSFLVVVYAIGLLSFARTGLAGDGRIYLLALLILALILIDARVGFLMGALSLFTFRHYGHLRLRKSASDIEPENIVGGLPVVA